MIESRRHFITKLITLSAYGLTLTSGILHSPVVAAEWLKQRFSLSHYDETISHIFKGEKLIDNHNKIKITRLPYVAENGAVVPIKISSHFDKITKIYILVEKNPYPLSAEFFISPAVEAEVSARLKMAKTSYVIVIVEADGKFYRKIKKVKVAIGGCGG
jgi:sulfur-oxidizing protein SoxY